MAGAAWLALLTGCAAGPEVQTLATGRIDVSAYVLNGGDIDSLRQEARLLCPLGGEVLRQSGQGAVLPEPAQGRWRRALQATALWLDPPARSAQLVIVCREPGDRMRLAPPALAAPSAPSAPAAAGLAAGRPAVPASAGMPEWSVGLPVGPVNPEW